MHILRIEAIAGSFESLCQGFTPIVCLWMKIVYNKIIPFGRRYYAINLFGILFAKGPLDRVSTNHELIHSAQMKEMLYLPFYIAYVAEWLWKLIIYRHYYEAYACISFEREAYANQSDLSYLSNRRKWAFTKYLRKPNK